MKAIWHWLNRMVGRHTKKCSIIVACSTSTSNALKVTAHRCDTCGHGWIEIEKIG